MTPPGDINVVTSGIRRHADRVEGIGRQLDTARGAAAQVTMDVGAYGLLCGPVLVPVLGTLEGAGIGTIDCCALSIDGTALALRAMANFLDDSDDAAANRVTASGNGLK